MYFVGLDVHLGHRSMCVLDKNGRRIKQAKVRGPWSSIADELEELDGPVSVRYEASCGCGRIYELLMPMCQRVVVAHPGQLRLIFRSKRKNDRGHAVALRARTGGHNLGSEYSATQNGSKKVLADGCD